MELPPQYSSHIDAHRQARAFDEIAEGTYPDMHEVVPNAWLGNQRAAGLLFPYEDTAEARAQRLAALRARDVELIVCCCGEGKPWRVFEADGMQYVDAFLKDGSEEDVRASFSLLGSLVERATPLVRGVLARKKGFLVHCNSGIHRSASVMVALLQVIDPDKIAGAEAFRRVVARRSVAYPNMWPYLESTEWAAVVKKLRKPRILFLCVHNAGRSQMAAAYCRVLGKDACVVGSGGSDPADVVHAGVIDAMLDDGIDLKNEIPRILDSSQKWDAVITMVWQFFSCKFFRSRRCSRVVGRRARFFQARNARIGK